MEIFNSRVGVSLFNIYTQDPNRHNHLEEELNIKMEKAEFDFLEDQKLSRVGFCENFMDRKLEQRAKMLSQVQSRCNAENESVNDHTDSNASNCDNDCAFNSKSNNTKPMADQDDNLNEIGQMIEKLQDIPEKWSHIRLPDGNIRPDFYNSIDQLINVYQCNKYQAVSAVITVANMMFGRRWKHHNGNDLEIDIDTAPEVKAVNQTGIEKTIEFVALKCILEDIMEVGEANISFHLNNSKYLSIQGVTINDKFRTFPKMSIAKESRENFKDMRLAVLNVLAVYAAVSPDELLNKITFSMSDDANPEGNAAEAQVALEVSRYTINDKGTNNLAKRFEDEQFDMIIDVRSPGEFQQDHIPRAINLPVLNNEERCKVGTMYSGKI